jgi:hypothetical protein
MSDGHTARFIRIAVVVVEYAYVEAIASKGKRGV